MQCEQNREVITQITEMNETVVNELQAVYEHLFEKYLTGAGLVLDVSRERVERVNSSLSTSGFALRSNSILLKLGDGRGRYDNDNSEFKSDFDSESDTSFNGRTPMFPSLLKMKNDSQI